MCDPTAIALGSLVIGAIGTIGKAKAQDKAAADNKAAALDSFRNAQTDIDLQQTQQEAQTGRSIYETDRSARATTALARVSAGEAGVSGISVEALLGDIDRKAGEFRTTAKENLGMVVEQLQREKSSGRTVAQQRIASVQPANPFAVATTLAGQGLQFWAGQIGRDNAKPTPLGTD